MIFQYKPEYFSNLSNPQKNGVILRPVIQIRFKINGNYRAYPVLIDSGADYCIFHADLAKDLGIELKTGIKLDFTGTLREKQLAYLHKVTFYLGNKKIESVVAFSNEIEALPFGLLGQQGFFDKFKVSFDLKKKEIEIT